MTAIARFEVLPTQNGNTSARIADALQVLDQYPVTYETTATDTIIEADTVEDVFAAAQAAHRAIPGGRVVTSLQVDEVRGREQHIGDRIASVERELGRPPRKIRHPVSSQQGQTGMGAGQQGQPQPATGQQGQTQPIAAQQAPQHQSQHTPQQHSQPAPGQHPQPATGQHGQSVSPVQAQPTGQNQSMW